MAELFAGILEPLVGNLVKARTGLRARRLELVTLRVAPRCDLSFSLWFSLLLLLLLVLVYFFPRMNHAVWDFFPGLSLWLWHIFCSTILRNDSRQGKESVAGSSKHTTLQEVQFFTTWILKSTLLDTPILRDSDRLTERPWVLTIYINHSGGNLVHIHKHSDAWWLNDPLQSMFRWFEYTEWRKPLISYPDPLREKQSKIWVRD